MEPVWCIQKTMAKGFLTGLPVLWQLVSHTQQRGLKPISYQWTDWHWTHFLSV